MKESLLPWYRHAGREAGVDEAGRGCLAGPVTAAAVILPEAFDLEGLNDSKKLTERQREHLRGRIEEQAVAWAVAMIDNRRIDEMNILRATWAAMHQAVKGLKKTPDFLLIDGRNFLPYPGIPHRCIIKGDSKYAAIAAASILAKTWRDQYMKELHEKYPVYGWAGNKGYPTRLHRKAIRQYGTTPYHRMTFRLLDEQQKIIFPGVDE
jgi:ribonuclease HII